MKNLTAIIEQAEEDGDFAYCPEVKGEMDKAKRLKNAATCYRAYP